MTLPARLTATALALLMLLLITTMWKMDGRGPEDLQVQAEFVEREDGLLELHLSWQWDEPIRLQVGRVKEELLAVSFDTRELLFEAEEASYGVGANGDSISLLEQVAGFNGARRFYVVPQGRDGEARVLLRPTVRSGLAERQIRIHTVVDPGQGEAAVREMMVMAPAPGGAGTDEYRSET